jgi:uncharacterized lipoprotein YddW (UPF0748 family)
MEVVKKYDVDGIHFDYIRFPYSGYEVNSDWDLGYSELSRKAFKAEHGFDPLEIKPTDEEKVRLWDDWRRSCVAKLVEAVYRGAKELKPGIRVSGAVLHRYHLARAGHCFQDWLDWLQRGIIDTCCIMAYSADNEYVGKIIRMAVENKGKGTIWAGLRSRRESGGRGGGTFTSMVEQVEIVRRHEPEGIIFFAYGGFGDIEIRSLREGPFSKAAKVPGQKKAE